MGSIAVLLRFYLDVVVDHQSDHHIFIQLGVYKDAFGECFASIFPSLLLRLYISLKKHSIQFFPGPFPISTGYEPNLRLSEYG